MVRMGNVWDRTLEVLNGRGGMLAGVAVLTLFVPAAINAAYAAYVPAGGIPRAFGALALTLATTVAALWGQLWIIAAAVDPSTDRAAARRQADARLMPAIGVGLLLAVVVSLAFLPTVALLAAAGVDLSAMMNGGQTAVTAPGAAGLAGLYTLVMLVVLLFLGARMLPLYAVVLRERLAVGAIARSWRLTRRHTWRIVGVLLLFLVVLLIATWAAQSVVGLIVRLILGPDARATVALIAALAGQAASTALTLIAIVFSGQLYVALVAREQALRERRAQAA